MTQNSSSCPILKRGRYRVTFQHVLDMDPVGAIDGSGQPIGGGNEDETFSLESSTDDTTTVASDSDSSSSASDNPNPNDELCDKDHPGNECREPPRRFAPCRGKVSNRGYHRFIGRWDKPHMKIVGLECQPNCPDEQEVRTEHEGNKNEIRFWRQNSNNVRFQRGRIVNRFFQNNRFENEAQRKYFKVNLTKYSNCEKSGQENDEERTRKWENIIKQRIQRDRRFNEIKFKQLKMEQHRLEDERMDFDKEKYKIKVESERKLDLSKSQERRLKDTAEHCKRFEKQLKQREAKLLQGDVKYEEELADLEEKVKIVSDREEELKMKDRMLTQEEARLRKEREILLEFVQKCTKDAGVTAPHGIGDPAATTNSSDIPYGVVHENDVQPVIEYYSGQPQGSFVLTSGTNIEVSADQLFKGGLETVPSWSDKNEVGVSSSFTTSSTNCGTHNSQTCEPTMGVENYWESQQMLHEERNFAGSDWGMTEQERNKCQFQYCPISGEESGSWTCDTGSMVPYGVEEGKTGRAYPKEENYNRHYDSEERRGDSEYLQRSFKRGFNNSKTEWSRGRSQIHRDRRARGYRPRIAPTRKFGRN